MNPTEEKYVLRAKDFSPYVLYFRNWSDSGAAEWTKLSSLAHGFPTKEVANTFQKTYDLEATTTVVLFPALP